MASPPSPATLAARRAAWLKALPEAPHGPVVHERSVPFGAVLSVECFRLGNGSDHGGKSTSPIANPCAG